MDETQKQPEEEQSNEQITKSIESQTSDNKFIKILPILFIVVIVAAGIFTGLILSTITKSSSAGDVLSDEENLSPEIKQDIAQTFSDEAQGVLEKNDELDKYAQGTHKLIRPGGEDQTAYLTSSVLDLNEFEGEEIKVFGETFGSSQVGWLMDVGKVEVIK